MASENQVPPAAQPVDVRGERAGVAVEAEVVGAERVDRDHHNVGRRVPRPACLPSPGPSRRRPAQRVEPGLAGQAHVGP